MEQGKIDSFFDANLAARKEKPKHFSMDKAIDNLVGTFCDPIIVYPGGWATSDFIPKWLKERITMDRLIEQMVANKEGREPMGTDSEALAYMMPASMEMPMDHDWSQIYLYLGTKVIDTEISKANKMPDDVRVDQLDRGQEDDLRRLKVWLYHAKEKHRTEKARDIRKAEEKERQEDRAALQTALFSF